MVGSPTKRRAMRRPLEKAGVVGLAVLVTATAALLLLLLVRTASLRYTAAVDYALASPRKLWSGGVSIAAEASPSPSPEKGHGAGAAAMAAVEEEECDLFDGSWVWDDSYPLYDSKDCPFLDGGFRCSENGRPDTSYVKWRWQPSRCDLPRLVGWLVGSSSLLLACAVACYQYPLRLVYVVLPSLLCQRNF
ncbi:unnamed protein product [Triticum turgidum subsp. durum]|uniref:Trichome birefringence-like N-terminal domain-containing protein n=1 Tax=Triticum turgidum subsp. durum TaxID=4567 RepID=A0A9R0PZ75_TRITD|nr:unnamed protein product [Triticum turgidum subsp. durum]